MASIFHQNMRRYGGGSVPRNTAYRGPLPVPPAGGGAFAAIRLAVGAGPVGPIAVAGFTEITNMGAALTALNGCSLSLTGPGGQVGMVRCGITALAHGWEYIGIAISGAWPLLTVGRILIDAGGGGVTLRHQRAATFGALLALGNPAGGFSADYRGLAYVVVTTPGGQNVAIGFLHNMYTFIAQRISVAAQVPNMAAMMGNAFGALPAVPAIAARYIGGDFNVAMINPRGGLSGYQQVVTAAMAPAWVTPGGTTSSGSPYDYWYSSIPAAGPAPGGLIVPVPSISMNTLDHRAGWVPVGSMSDHVGIRLRIT